jgi:hypothetical protein
MVCKRGACGDRRKGAPQGVPKMLDIIMLAIGLGFFALSVGYAMVCDQL